MVRKSWQERLLQTRPTEDPFQTKASAGQKAKKHVIALHDAPRMSEQTHAIASNTPRKKGMANSSMPERMSEQTHAIASNTPRKLPFFNASPVQHAKADAEYLEAPSWLTAPPSFEAAGSGSDSDEDFAETKAGSADDEDLSSDEIEFEAHCEVDPLDSTASNRGGPWEAGGLQFFSHFDSGNCAGVTVTPGTRDSIPKKPDRSPDVIWAAAGAEQSTKLLYEVVQSRCLVHDTPDSNAKIITRKSKGANFFAGNRSTLDGWQALVGEKGWVFLDNGASGVARLLPSGGSSTVERYRAPAEEPVPGFCSVRPDSKPVVTTLQTEGGMLLDGSQVVRIRIGDFYFVLRVDKLPSMHGTVLESEAIEGIPAQVPTTAAETKHCDDQSTLCFDVKVQADCEGTPFARDDCQWFHFGVRGQPAGCTKLRFRLLGLSRFKKFEAAGVSKGPLLTDGLQPVFRYCYAEEHASTCDREWRLVDGNYGVQRMQNGLFACTFEHSLGEVLAKGAEVYFALTFPYPLERIHRHLNMICQRFIAAGAYVWRERLVNSLGGRPIEMLTVSARSGRSRRRQPHLQGLRQDSRRPRIFPHRQAVFVSCRVHPGETPASFMLEGILDFLASGDTAARTLLERYVFHIVPVLNPDGVALGHHRTDILGENLNRVYGDARIKEHPSIYAAQAACAAAHEHQGGLRLYLDLHAHSNRRGAFLLGDADVRGGLDQAKARLFGYAMGRRCSVFEYAQSDFNHAVPGTGKSAISQLTGTPLCFTVESHYFRGHHDTHAFGPAIWRGIGRSCLEALLDCDQLERSTKPPRSLEDVRRADLKRALQWLTTQAFGAASFAGYANCSFEGPSRARPCFGKVLGTFDGHEPSPEVLALPELTGRTVEVIEHEWRASGSEPPECWLRLHEADGGLWVPSRDLKLCVAQTGRFFYGALTSVAVSSEPTAGMIAYKLTPGTGIEVCERRVVDGVLRLRLVEDSIRGRKPEWISEYSDVLFDPKLGGTAQLMRLKGPPVKPKAKGLYYAYAC